MIETGIKFDNIHSFYDLNLILSSVDIPPASPKTTYIDIPGGNGSLDLTEALGEVKYADRVQRFGLTMNPAGDLSEAAWEEKKTEVSNYLNGRACKITLDKDPDYYWIGRCAVDSYTSSKRLRQFVISATVRPYKYKQNETVVPVVLTDNTNYTAVTLKNSRKSVCPVITCTNDNTIIVFGGRTFKFGTGTYKDLGIRLVHGDNELTVSGTGTVTFKYQEADL